MHPHCREFVDFYESALGKITKRLLCETLYPMMRLKHYDGVCKLGYCLPFTENMREEKRKLPIFNSIFSGVLTDHNAPSIVVDENHLPLNNGSQEKLLCAHLFEYTASPEKVIKEITRVLSPAGEVFFIIPNRRGLWVKYETTPFGQGKPYAKKQLIDIFKKHNLVITEHKTSLFFPPIKVSSIRLYVNMAEYIGQHSFLSDYGGVHIIKAVKKNYIPPTNQEGAGTYIDFFSKPILSPKCV